MIVFQIVKPFLNRCGCHIIKFIDTNDIVFRKDVLWNGHPYLIGFFCVYFQLVSCVHTRENGFSVVEIVTTLTKVKIEDIDGVHLLYLVILVTYLNMFRDGFGDTIKHTLEIIQLTSELHFHDDNFTFAVFCFDVNTVEFVIA